MYHIFKRCYPQSDIDVTEEWELESFSNLKRANAFVQDLEKLYNDEEWKGHRLYKAKFYVMEV